VTAYEVILRKRGGEELEPAEIEYMVRGLLDGRVLDYQMSAFLMAVFFRGMTDAETETLTRVMLATGTVLDLGDAGGAKVDKHSTGGVGDKLSLIVAPIAAAAGLRVPMISGRGLGHTGGTLDKLESIPGLSTDFSAGEVERLVAEVGMAIVGQSPEMAPADRRMYALRDVTATIECPPLIAGSILSKKLAAGLDALVLDVKVGRGAFMADVESATDLAERLIAIAGRLGLPTSAVLTRMECPLGLTVGNALEVREAVDVLRGEGPPDVREVSLVLAARMIALGGIETDEARALELAAGLLDDGQALERFAKFVAAQGGDPSVTERPDILPAASVVAEVTAPRGGFVAGIDALEIGLAAVGLGAGRSAVGDPVDPAVGVEIAAALGSEVGVGSRLALVHASDETLAGTAVGRVGAAFSISSGPPNVGSRIIAVVDAPAG
jgi:pyrimidine-nucleoside phosphorylase